MMFDLKGVGARMNAGIIPDIKIPGLDRER